MGNVRRKKGVVAVGPERRAVPIARPFFDAVDGYREAERPSSSATDRLFLADKGPAKGTPFSKDQFHEVLERARIRAGLDHLGSRRLREIGLRCLRAGGMDEDALRMQIGEQPLIQRTERWHCEEYQRVAPCLDALIPGPGGERRSI